MKKIFLLLFLVLGVVFSQAQSPADSAFSKFYVSIEGGEIYPFGDLPDAVENTFYGGVGVRYSYWDDADGFLNFNYAYFEPRVSDVPFAGVHQFSGKVGLDFRLRLIAPFVVGAGFACNWTRADLDDAADKDKLYGERGGTLTDNETEFGWFVRLNLPLWNFEKTRIGFNLLWEELWTLPERSDMLTAGIYIERRIW